MLGISEAAKKHAHLPPSPERLPLPQQHSSPPPVNARELQSGRCKRPPKNAKVPAAWSLEEKSGGLGASASCLQPSHVCASCGKSFYSASYLSQHQRIHSSHKPYGCQVCSRRFTQLSHLQQHQRTHTGERPYKCQHPGCPKAFSQLSNLQTHSRTHVPATMYKCTSCYKCFDDGESLLIHSRTHVGSRHLRMYACLQCGKSYTQDTYLQNHMKLKHGDANSGSSAMSSTVLKTPRPAMKHKDMQPVAGAEHSDAKRLSRAVLPTQSSSDRASSPGKAVAHSAASCLEKSQGSYMACYATAAAIETKPSIAHLPAHGALPCVQPWQPPSHGGSCTHGLCTHQLNSFRDNPGYGYALFTDPDKRSVVWRGHEGASAQAGYMLPMYQSFVPRSYDKYSF